MQHQPIRIRRRKGDLAPHSLLFHNLLTFPLSFSFIIFPNLACQNVRGLMTEGLLRNYKRLIKENKFDFLCLLEIKLNMDSLCSSFDERKLRSFSFEKRSNNFERFSGDKWNSQSLQFTPIFTTPQLIHGSIMLHSATSFFVTCIYAHNDALDRR